MLRNLLVTAALVSTGFMAFSAQSATNEPKVRDFVIQNNDGYGTSDCLARESACGKIVADSWCESKGFARARAYRAAAASDITHSVSTRRAAHNETFVISCAE